MGWSVSNSCRGTQWKTQNDCVNTLYPYVQYIIKFPLLPSRLYQVSR